MKAWHSFLLLTLGITGIFVFFYTQSVSDKNRFEIQYFKEKQKLDKQINRQWHGFLEGEFQKGRLASSYPIFISLVSKEVVEFFPQKKIDPADTKAHFLGYRRSDFSLEEKKVLINALYKRKSSWLRALAIAEAKKLGLSPPDDMSTYEVSLIDETMKEKVQRVFRSKDEILSKVLGDSAESEPELAVGGFAVQSFPIYRASKDRLTVYLLPNDLRKRLLKDFKALVGLKNVKYSSKSDDAKVVLRQIDEITVVASNNQILLAFSLILILASVLVFVAIIRRERRLITKRISFLNQVIHEVKTPIAGLKLHLQLFEKGLSRPGSVSASGSGEKGYKSLESQENKKLIEPFSKSVNRINQLFDDLLLIQNSDEKPVLEEIIDEDLDKIAYSLKEEFGEKVIFKRSSNWRMKTDIRRLKIILRNLVKNAVYYGEVAEIEAKSGDSKITVVDRGPGVSKEDSERIFEEFYRGEKSREVRPDGLGIGLSIVSRMAREMNAKIRLENPGEAGARFSIHSDLVI